jgi:hypothetical protein
MQQALHFVMKTELKSAGWTNLMVPSAGTAVRRALKPIKAAHGAAEVHHYRRSRVTTVSRFRGSATSRDTRRPERPNVNIIDNAVTED